MLKLFQKRLFSYWIESYFVFKNDLQTDTLDEISELPENYSIKIISETDDNKYIETLGDLWHRAYFDLYKNKAVGIAHKEVRTMLKQGDICFGIFYHEDLVGMAWHGGTSAIMRMHFAHFIKSEKKACIGHHAYVDPEHRGHRLHAHLKAARLRYSMQSGYLNSYIFVGVNNIASVINSFKVYPRYKVIYHIKIDAPFLTFNFFPKTKSSEWSACRPSVKSDYKHMKAGPCCSGNKGFSSVKTSN